MQSPRFLARRGRVLSAISAVTGFQEAAGGEGAPQSGSVALQHPFLVGAAVLLLGIAIAWAWALFRKRDQRAPGADGEIASEGASVAGVRRNFSFAGGVVALVLFLWLGLAPAILYGAFVGRTLATGILGIAGESLPLYSAIVLFGMLLGVLATGALFVVVGGAAGAGLYLAWTRLSRLFGGGRGSTGATG